MNGRGRADDDERRPARGRRKHRLPDAAPVGDRAAPAHICPPGCLWHQRPDDGARDRG